MRGDPPLSRAELIRSVTGERPAPEMPDRSEYGIGKGVRKRATTTVITQILQAMDELGGVDYLVKVGRENPKAFLTILAKVIPQQVDINDSSGLVRMLEERMNNARILQAREMQRVAERAAQLEKRTIDGESRVVVTP